MRIRAGEFLYEDLLKQAEEKIQVVDELFKQSDLPDSPDPTMAELQLIAIREIFYEKPGKEIMR